MARPVELGGYLEGLKPEDPAQAGYLNLLLSTYRGLRDLGMNPLELPSGPTLEQSTAKSLETTEAAWRLKIGGKSSEELQKELRQRGVKVSSYAQDMLESKDFATLKEPEEIDLVRLTVSDLGLSETATADQIYQAAQEHGYELCPAEVGPHLRLAYQDQPTGEWFSIGMKQIADRHGDPSVFGLERRGDGLWLDSYWALPTDEWHPDDEFVFRLRKST